MEENNVIGGETPPLDNSVIESHLKDILDFLKSEKELQNKEKEELKKQENELKKIEEKNNKKIEEENKKLSEKQDKFYENINSIVENTDSNQVQENQQILVESINNLNTLTQVNIACFGLMIGIFIISMFSKYFRR